MISIAGAHTSYMCCFPTRRALTTSSPRLKRSEGHHRTNTKHRRIADPPVRRNWVRYPAAGIEDVLEILQDLPPAGKLTAIGAFQQRFARANRESLTGEAGDIGIEIARRLSNPRIADRQTHLVILAIEWPVIDDPGIGVEAGEVTIT